MLSLKMNVFSVFYFVVPFGIDSMMSKYAFLCFSINFIYC